MFVLGEVKETAINLSQHGGCRCQASNQARTEY
jgi:hypothetical protein